MSQSLHPWALKVVDRREEGPWKPFYLLSVTCNLCAMTHVVMLSKGFLPTYQTDRCPFCEVEGRCGYHDTPKAINLLKTHSSHEVLAPEEQPDGGYFVTTNQQVPGYGPVTTKAITASSEPVKVPVRVLDLDAQ